MELQSSAGADSPSPLAPPDRQRLLSGTRLKLRLAVLTLLVVSLLTGQLLLLVGRVFENLTPSLDDDLRWKAQRGVAELSHSADLGVLTADPAQLQAATAHYTRDGDFLYVAFHDAQGKLLFERGNAAALPQIQATAEALSEGEHAYAAWAGLEVEGLRVGSVTLAMSKHRLQAGAKLYHRMVLAGLVGAGFALLLALLFVQFYVAPILRLTERTFVELAHTAEAALASAKAKSQFLANMSHEIRTPMNGVFGMLHLVQQTTLSEAQRRYMGVIAASAKSLLKIVNDILDFSKLDAQKYQLAPEPASVRDLVEQTTHLFEQKAEEKGLALSCRVYDNVPPVVLLDGDRFRQVLSNLLSNAVKFTPAGAVNVEVAYKAEAQATLEVHVRDTGVGIADADLARLFVAFEQVDSSSTRSHEGTGLGLAISRKLVELMGGTLSYERPSSGGSCFVCRIPVVTCEPAAIEPAAPPTLVETFSSERPVLLVDDNEINQLVAVEILEKLGLRVDVAGGGQEAIEAALEGDYALVLMDCQMPDIDGYQAAQEIRKREAPGKRLPIIAFTAHVLKEERNKVLGCGMDDYLVKPIEPDALQRVLSRFLSPAATTTAARESRTSEPVPDSHVSPRANGESSRPANVRTLSAEIVHTEALRAQVSRPARAVELFLTTVPRQLELLRQACDDGRHEDVRTLAHKLKGSSGMLGALGMAKVCERLQYVPDTASVPLLLEHMALIDATYASASELLRHESVQGRGTP